MDDKYTKGAPAMSDVLTDPRHLIAHKLRDMAGVYPPQPLRLADADAILDALSAAGFTVVQGANQ